MLACLALPLSGCAGTLSRNSAPPPLAVDIGALKTCEQLMHQEPLAAAKPGDSADIGFLKADAATMNANDRLRVARKCVGDVRQRYGGKTK